MYVIKSVKFWGICIWENSGKLESKEEDKKLIEM